MKSKSKLIIILVIVLIVLGGGGAWFFLHQSASGEKSKDLSADAILANMVETQPITTNLNPDGFIQISFNIQTSSTKAKEELQKRDFQVRNSALRLLSSMTEAQVNSPNGMAAFEKEMKDEINKLMQNGSIVRIYTTNKMIQ